MKQVPEGLIKGILSFHPMPDEEPRLFFEKWTHWSHARDFHFLREGQIADYIWFVESGSVRIYYKKEDREITEWLALDGQFFYPSVVDFKQLSTFTLPQEVVVENCNKVLVPQVEINEGWKGKR